MYKTPQGRTTFWSCDVEKLHAAVARSTLASQNVKNWRSRSTFWSWCFEKLHAVVARSTFVSQNVQNTSGGPLFEVAMSKTMSKNCTPLWREAHWQVKMLKNWRSRRAFWSSDVEKLHAVVARSTFASQNVKKLAVSDHFLKLMFRKIARRCGEKHICKSKCTKHLRGGPLFEVAMSKNCTPLWREAHWQVKMLKNWRSRSAFWSSDV